MIEPGELDGVRLAKNLRAQNVPVLFTSIYPATDDLLELAPSAYLVKPFPLYALERALERALAASARGAAAASGPAGSRAQRLGGRDGHLALVVDRDDLASPAARARRTGPAPSGRRWAR